MNSNRMGFFWALANPTLKKFGLLNGNTSAVLVAAIAALLACGETCLADVAAWTQWEQTLTSSANYANPYQDVKLDVTYTGPSGQTFKGLGFWDGGKTFKIRFMFPAAGQWKWTTTCSDASDAGLHNKSGTVKVVEYTGDNPLYKNGYLKVSDNKRYVTYANGEPFLWIGDTPWSVFVTATQEEWERYLKNRKDNKFTVMQVHCGGCWDWVGKLKTDRYKNSPFTGSGKSLQWNPAYWQQVDRKVQAANDLGLLVYICAVRQPGSGFPIEDAQQVKLFAGNLAARMMGRFVVYSPMADDLWTPQADAAGKALDQATQIHLISVHPRFFLEPAITSHGKDYVDIVGLQSGEGWRHDPYKKEPNKPFSTPLAAQNAYEWPLILYKLTPIKPVINEEGPYDHPIEKDGRVPLPPRKAGYWSFLSGAKGHTYGCFGIWNWGTPVGWFPAYDFEMALNVPTVKDMKYLSEFFASIPWWTLEPCHELVKNQAGDWMHKMGMAKSAAGDLGVAYLPDNAEITIDMKAFPTEMKAKWFNPKTGQYETISGAIPSTGSHTFRRPKGWEDALLVLTTP
jgi:hypothetical protein